MGKKTLVTMVVGFCFILASTGILCMATEVMAAAKESPIVLKVSHSLPGNSKGTKVVISKKFKELVEQRSGGKLKVELHPGAELYKDPDGLVATARGTIFSQVISSDALATWEKGIEILSMYGMFDDREHCTRFVAHEKGGQEIFRRLEKKGLVVSLFQSGTWMLWTKDKVSSIDDLSGMKIRTTKSKMEAASMKALGCIVYPLPVSELYTAAQTGLVAGAVTQPLSIASRKLEEVFHFALQKPAFNINSAGMAVSKIVLNSLPSDLKKIVLQAINEANDYTNDQAAKVDEYYTEKLKGSGVTFVTLPPPEAAKFKKRFKTVHDEFIKENPKALKGLLEVVEQVEQTK
jgi:C4-dicarboxylate-binding protein DctP